MGQNLSREEKLSYRLLTCLLKDKGVSVSEDLVLQFLQIIIEYNPWFSDEGTLDIECWECIGQNLEEAQQQGKNLPPNCFSLWKTVLQLLEPFREESPPPLAPSAPKKKQKDKLEEWPSCPDSETFKLPLTESPMQKAIRKGLKDMTVEDRLVFPIVQVANPQFPNQIIRQHGRFDFKMIKALRDSVIQNGANAPFTGEIITNISEAFLAPYDWYSLGHATLDRGDYLLWKGEFLEKCQEQASSNLRQNVLVTSELLAGQGQFSDVHNQLQYIQQAYEQIRLCGRKAWWSLPVKGEPEGAFSKCMQGSTVSFSDFVAHLTRAVRRQIQHETAGDILTQQLAYENANMIVRNV